MFLEYKIRKLLLRTILRQVNGYKKANFIKKCLYSVGDNCCFYTTHFGTDPYLINIHNNVIIADDVSFYTHDASCIIVKRYLNSKQRLDKVGGIEIEDNCFIGAKAIILPNVKIGANSIVAAGSVVIKDVPSGSVVGGNPAKIICTIEEHAKKLIESNKQYPWIHMLGKNQKVEDIIQSRKEYFWGK